MTYEPHAIHLASTVFNTYPALHAEDEIAVNPLAMAEPVLYAHTVV